MKLRLFLAIILFAPLVLLAQNFELVDKEENYQSGFDQLVRISLKIKNISDKPQFYVVKRSRGDLGEFQKGYFCLDSKCLEPAINEFSKKIEPGETINLNYTIESGIQQIQNSFKFEIFPKNAPTEMIEHNVSLTVDERSHRLIYQSREITINDFYPNPVQDWAVIDYKINDDLLKAKIVVHNILGRSMGEYELTAADTRIKFSVDEYAPGVYFYTLYINNNGVLTRKIMVRK